jgi:FAD-dependent oxidoreductase domain-containing protein 1
LGRIAASVVTGHAVVIGGGVMGMAVARFLARDHGWAVTVLERDPTYRRASSALSASSIRVQFTTAVNVALSRWSFEFLEHGERELAVAGTAPALGLTERAYLYLATAAGAQRLRQAHALQRAAGADVALIGAAELRGRFPWLATDDLEIGSLGGSGEGWFDGPALHLALRRQALAAGARVRVDAAVDFRIRGARVEAVETAAGERIAADAVVLCAGAWSGPLSARLGFELPVRARKRDVFVFDSPAVLDDCPLLIDPAGVWFRPEGRSFIAGAPPRPTADGGPGDPDEPPLEAVDHALFEATIWPVLAARVPAFETLRLRSAWAGYYEMNLFDHNGLAGPLPGLDNGWSACGFSGHGMQQAPAVGCALAGLIAGKTVAAPPLDALAPARIRRGEPLLELNVI